MLKNIKAVIFDLDGTLVDSMWIWKYIDIEYLDNIGVDMPKNLQKCIEGMSFTETARYFKNTFNIDKSVDEIKSDWNSMALDYYKHKIKLKKGVKEFLHYLKENNIKIGLGTSNSSCLAKEVLVANRIFNYFDAFRTACDVERGKPYPDVFLKVADDLNVKPEECLVFEDTFAGVLAAKRAGMKVFAVADDLSYTNKDNIMELADKYLYDFIDIA